MLTKDQRMQSWNVRFLVGTDAVAGIYQRNDMLHIADVAREIDLCLVFNRPDTESWQPALLLRDAATGPNQELLVLDQQDQTPFPTPRSKDAQQYDFVFHQHTQCAGESTHSLRGRAASPTSFALRPLTGFRPVHSPRRPTQTTLRPTVRRHRQEVYRPSNPDCPAAKDRWHKATQ